MAVAVVGELVVAGGELLEALRGDGGEVAGELRVLCQHHRAARHERVDQRLLPHGPRLALLPMLLPLRSSLLRRRGRLSSAVARRCRRRSDGDGGPRRGEKGRGRGREKRGNGNGGRGARGKRVKEVEFEVGGDEWEFCAEVLGASHYFKNNPLLCHVCISENSHTIFYCTGQI